MPILYNYDATWWGVVCAQRFVLLRSALVCKHPSHFGMQFKNIWFSKVVYIYALNVALQQFSFFLPQIIMAKSVQSAATTHGGVDFDDLVSGKLPPYYTFRPTRIKISKMYVKQCLQRGILNTQQPIQKIIITHCTEQQIHLLSGWITQRY